MRAGRVRRGDDEYPTGTIPAPRCEVVTLAKSLPAESVGAVEFADRIANALLDPSGGDERELLAAAVRVPLEARAEALRRLAPVLRTFADASPRDGAMLAPALRWLARTHVPGTDVSAWAHWVSNWVRNTDERARRMESDGLDLPGEASDVVTGADGDDVRDSKGGLDLP